MVIKVKKIPNQLTNDLNKLQKYKMQTNMIRFPLSDSWSQLTCTQTKEGTTKICKYWINIENAVFLGFYKYTTRYPLSDSWS